MSWICVGGRRQRSRRRRPGGEQAEPFGGGRAGFGGVDQEHEPGLGGDGELLVGEGELADDGVVEPLGAGAVGADVVVGPEPAEGLAPGGELADEVLQPAVVRVAAGLGAHDADAHLGEQVPVRVEVAGGRVEELEPGQVRRAATVADDGRVERAAEGVGGEQVLVRVADERDAVGDRLQRPLQARPGGGLAGGAAPRRGPRSGCRRRRGRGRTGGRVRSRRAAAPGRARPGRRTRRRRSGRARAGRSTRR